MKTRDILLTTALATTVLVNAACGGELTGPVVQPGQQPPKHALSADINNDGYTDANVGQ